MFDLDKWQEIFDSISRHRLRTTLTALGVFWGIFMLVILLGAGNGLQKGVEYEFRDDATNSIFIRRGRTSVEFNGLPEGRLIELKNDDLEYLQSEFPEIEYLTGRFYLSGDQTVAYQDQRLSYPVRAVHPDHLYLENTIITHGRFLNQNDLDDIRKVAVIGDIVRRDLFADQTGIGQEIRIGGAIYKVVGTYTDTGGENEMRIIYIPVTTGQKIYAASGNLHQIMFTTGDLSLEQSQVLQDEVRDILAARHQFDPADTRALWIFNLAEEVGQFNNLFFAIRTFIWVVGIGSILAGVIGVSNIMLIIVKDRTREIGIRKALGATPRSIVAMIVQESIFITALAGYAGLAAGVVILAAMSALEVQYFRHPEINIWVGLAATLVLVIAGTLAGLFPAIRAAQIDPVSAIKT